MTSISSVSSTSSVQHLLHMKGSGSNALAMPDDNSRQGKDGGGLLGAIDSALKSAGVSGGLSSIFGSQDSSGTSTDSTSSTSAADSTSSTEDSAKTNFDAFMQNLIAALQSGLIVLSQAATHQALAISRPLWHRQ